MFFKLWYVSFQILGLPTAISIFAAGFTLSAATVFLARLNGKDDFKVKDGLTISGVITAASLLYIDYLSFNGVVPLEIQNRFLAWINNGLIEVADLTKFFVFLVIGWKLLDYQFPGKMEFFNKVTG